MKAPSEKELLEEIVKTVEGKSGKKIKTIQVQSDEPSENAIYAIVYFTDGSKLDSKITIQTIKDKLALRIQGNYI